MPYFFLFSQPESDKWIIVSKCLFLFMFMFMSLINFGSFCNSGEANKTNQANNTVPISDVKTENLKNV